MPEITRTVPEVAAMLEDLSHSCCHANWVNSAFASCKSVVSKPSVNQS
jgi:hypothetical protein